MIDKMFSTLLSKTAHVCGWIVEKLKTVELTMAGFEPARRSCYFVVPSELQGIRSLVNSRNHIENKGFLSYFSMVHDLFHGSPLQTVTWGTIASQPLYSSYNLPTHQAKADFHMPMWLKDMANFEIPNNVLVKVLRYENKQLFPLRL